MVEFFENIYNWFIINKDEILVWLSSANFATFVSVVIVLIKQFKSTKQATEGLKDVNSTLTESNTLAKTVTDVSASSNTAVLNTEDIKCKLNTLEKDFSKSLDCVVDKLNAVIKVQSIVYSSITDETVRKNIADILTTAEISRERTVAELEKEIQELKDIISTKVSDVQEVVDNVCTKSKVKKTSATKKNITQRY